MYSSTWTLITHSQMYKCTIQMSNIQTLEKMCVGVAYPDKLGVSQLTLDGVHSSCNSIQLTSALYAHIQDHLNA